MVTIITIAGIVALVWSALALRYGGLLVGPLAVVFVGSCFGHAFYHVSVGPIPITLDRLLLAAVLLVFVAACRTSLVAHKPLEATDWILGLFLAALTFSTLSHNWRVDGSQPAATLLFFYGLPAAVYFLARQSQLASRHLHLLLGFFVVFSLYLGTTAIAERLQLWSFVFPRYIGSPAHEEFFGRARGPFLNPVACGLYLTSGLIATLCGWPRFRSLGRLTLLALASVMVLGAYCTLTRSVWLGLGSSVLLVVILSVHRTWRLPLFVFVALAATVFVTLMGDHLTSFKRDRHVSVHDMNESARLRPILARIALNMFRDRPILGHGFGQYKHTDMNYWRDPKADLPLESAKPYVQHNVFLSILTETGLVGLLLYTTLLALWAKRGWQVWSNADRTLVERQVGLLTLAALTSHVANGMFHEVSIIPMSNMLLMLITGVCQGIAASRAVPAGHRRSAADRLPGKHPAFTT